MNPIMLRAILAELGVAVDDEQTAAVVTTLAGLDVPTVQVLVKIFEQVHAAGRAARHGDVRSSIPERAIN